MIYEYLNYLTVQQFAWGLVAVLLGVALLANRLNTYFTRPKRR